VTPQKHGVLHNLYVGTGAFDIIGKRKRWYIAFAVLIVICLGSIGIKNFNYGIDFTGGTQIQMPVKGQTGTATVDGVLQVYKQTLGHDAEQAQTVGSGNSETIQLRSAPLDGTQVVKFKEALFAKFKPLGANGQPTQQAISDSAVSSSWGGDISRQALIALAVFLVLVTIFLTFYFERAMAAAALASLVNDLIVTAGVYSITGFEVTPVVGIVPPDLPLSPHPGEVAALFEAPLHYLLDPAHHHVRSAAWRGQERHYYEIDYEGRRIWGATAAMIVNLSRRLVWRFGNSPDRADGSERISESSATRAKK